MRVQNCEVKTISKKDREFDLLLKEWELSQNDRESYNRWAWQIGSIFIALSLAALWASSEADGLAVWGFFLFSTSSLYIWIVFIVWRARFFIRSADGKMRTVEHDLVKLVYGENTQDKKLLRTHIRDLDEKRPWYKSPRSIYGVMIFIIIIHIVWFLTLDFKGLFSLSCSLPIFFGIVTILGFITLLEHLEKKRRKDP